MKAISIAVKSENFCRIFTTKTFSIRNLITQIRRYNPHAICVCLWYGDHNPSLYDFANNDEWTSIPEGVEIGDEMCQSIPRTKEGLLKEYDYRTAVNMSYVQDLNNGNYPKLHPFKGVRREGNLPPELSQYKYSHYPLFIADSDNPYTNKEDILRHLDGYRIEKMVNGYDVEGYIIENNRYSTTTDAE